MPAKKKPVKKLAIKKSTRPTGVDLYHNISTNLTEIVTRREEAGETPEQINLFINKLFKKLHSEVMVKYQIQEACMDQAG